MFEAIVLLNSPSTGPTRPFLGGLTGDGNVKIVHPPRLLTGHVPSCKVMAVLVQ